jgi:3-hydroxybutyryl-CoA dehydrogenase
MELYSMKVDEIKRIAIVGAGLMGHQIGMEFALYGYDVILNNRTEESLQRAIKNIQDNMEVLTGLGLLTSEKVGQVMSHIQTSPVLNKVVEDVDVVIESVFEDLELKQLIFKELDRLCPERTILVSNTSTFMPSKVASVTDRPDSFLVANFWNPTYLIPLVEIVRSKETSDETVETIYNLLTKIGKKPVIEEEPGFVGNLLQGALYEEALSIVDKGIASAKDVDMIVKSSFGRRLPVAGIFEYLDTLGWDFIYHIYLARDSEIPEVLKNKGEKGELGAKTGKGFYKWTPESAEAFKQKLAQALSKTT